MKCVSESLYLTVQNRSKKKVKIEVKKVYKYRIYNLNIVRDDVQTKVTVCSKVNMCKYRKTRSV